MPGGIRNQPEQTAAPDPAAMAEGQSMFRGLCSGCHGGAGRGGKGPDLTDNRWIHGSTDADIARVIQNGVPNTTMKKLGDALKPEQIRKLIGYIRSLARSSGGKHLEAVSSAATRRQAERSSSIPRSKVQCANVIVSGVKAAVSAQHSIELPAAVPPNS